MIGELAQRFANIYARTNGFEDMSEDDMELMRTTQTEILEWLKIQGIDLTEFDILSELGFGVN